MSTSPASESTSGPTGERAMPFHCPYCGDGDLRPHERIDDTGEVTSPHGTWECRSCLRAFSLKMLGLVRPVGSRP